MNQNQNQKDNNLTTKEAELRAQKAVTFAALYGGIEPYNNDIFKQLKENKNESR